MAFKPNYGQQRAERNRIKQARAEEKQKAREQQIAQRKAGEPMPDESAEAEAEAEGSDPE